MMLLIGRESRDLFLLFAVCALIETLLRRGIPSPAYFAAIAGCFILVLAVRVAFVLLEQRTEKSCPARLPQP